MPCSRRLNALTFIPVSKKSMLHQLSEINADAQPRFPFAECVMKPLGHIRPHLVSNSYDWRKVVYAINHTVLG